MCSISLSWGSSGTTFGHKMGSHFGGGADQCPINWKVKTELGLISFYKFKESFHEKNKLYAQWLITKKFIDFIQSITIFYIYYNE